LLSAASILRDAQLPVRNVIVTALGPDRALLVVVLQNGQVENRYVECPPGTTLQHIGQANEALATACQGTTLRGLAKLKTPAHEDPVLAKFLRACAASLRNLGRDLTRGRLITEGEEYVMAQPEFARDASAMKALLAGIEDEEALHAAVAGDGVTIGREHAEERLHPLTIIRRTFTVGEDEAGSIAIVGPTRLQYERATGLLDFTASAVSQTLTKLLK
jgi:heat-inducible transcriptional repressor